MAETTEFIGGMDKIIAFIKSQGERVKKLEEENKRLKEQHQNCLETVNTELWPHLSADMSCNDCDIFLTEDDLQISMKHGSLICEGCYDERKEKEEEYQPKGSRIDPEGLHDFMKEQNDKLKKENEELKEQLRMSRLAEFFRMCESHTGFHKNQNLCDPDWLKAIRDTIDYMREGNMPTTDELFDDYKEFISYESEEESEDEQK